MERFDPQHDYEMGYAQQEAQETGALSDADLGHSLDHLRILTGEVCADCHSSDGEITPATEFTIPMYGPVEHLCVRHYGDREPPDQGEDDGPLTFAQRCEVDARDDWRMR